MKKKIMICAFALVGAKLAVSASLLKYDNPALVGQVQNVIDRSVVFTLSGGLFPCAYIQSDKVDLKSAMATLLYAKSQGAKVRILYDNNGGYPIGPHIAMRLGERYGTTSYAYDFSNLGINQDTRCADAYAIAVE